MRPPAPITADLLPVVETWIGELRQAPAVLRSGRTTPGRRRPAASPRSVGVVLAGLRQAVQAVAPPAARPPATRSSAPLPTRRPAPGLPAPFIAEARRWAAPTWSQALFLPATSMRTWRRFAGAPTLVTRSERRRPGVAPPSDLAPRVLRAPAPALRSGRAAPRPRVAFRKVEAVGTLVRRAPRVESRSGRLRWPLPAPADAPRSMTATSRRRPGAVDAEVRFVPSRARVEEPAQASDAGLLLLRSFRPGAPPPPPERGRPGAKRPSAGKTPRAERRAPDAPPPKSDRKPSEEAPQGLEWERKRRGPPPDHLFEEPPQAPPREPPAQRAPPAIATARERELLTVLRRMVDDNPEARRLVRDVRRQMAELRDLSRLRKYE
ncbi:MAG: hypothetical protein H6739_34850 [Alphaproteobacteria bacterium]|nr:hypothetical protein [Alphaproteobacteria bacterium]